MSRVDSSDSDRFLIGGYSSVKIGNKWFFWELNANALVSIDDNSYDIQVLLKCSQMEGNDGTAYSSVEAWNEYLVLAPFHSERICMFNTRTNELTYVELHKKGMYSNLYVIGNTAYLWGWGIGKVAAFDICKKEYRQVEELSRVEISSNACCDGSKLIGYNKATKRVFEYDVKDKYYRELDVDLNDMNINSVTENEGILWMAGDKKGIVKYNPKDNSSVFISFDDLVDINLELQDCFRTAMCCGNYIYFSPYRTNCLLRINCLNDDAEIIESLNENEIGGGFFLIDKTKIHWFVQAMGKDDVLRIYEINCLGEVDLKWDIGLKRGSKGIIDLFKGNLRETEYYGLKEYLSII